MAVHYNTRIVTDGLVLCLDAANVKSYPGSGTTWTDLSGYGNNGTLTNGPTYSSSNGGSIVFDGTNDYANFSSANNTFGTSSTQISSFLWIYPKSDGVILSILGQSQINFSYHHSAIEVGSSGELRMSLWHGSLTNRVNSTLSLNRWNNVGFSYDGTTLTGYLNGFGVGTTNFTWLPGSSVYFGIMATDSTNMGTSAYGDGNVASLHVYKKALTSSEIQQNFNALRGRYGV